MEYPLVTAIKSTYRVILKNVSYITRTSKAIREKRTLRTHKSINHSDDDDVPLAYIENPISNRKAKFISLNSGGKFGSFYCAKKLDKPIFSIGCRSPPLQSEFPSKNSDWRKENV